MASAEPYLPLPGEDEFLRQMVNYVRDSDADFELEPPSAKGNPRAQDYVRLQHGTGKIVARFIQSNFGINLAVFEKANATSPPSDGAGAEGNGGADAKGGAETGEDAAASGNEPETGHSSGQSSEGGEGNHPANANEDRSTNEAKEGEREKTGGSKQETGAGEGKDSKEGGAEASDGGGKGAPEGGAAEHFYFDPALKNQFLLVLKIYDDKYEDKHHLLVGLPMNLEARPFQVEPHPL